MFLSTENPPNDPSTSSSSSSSSNLLHLTSHCDELGQSHHNSNNTHLPNFSIRNYVCSYRSKDIKTNWPFSSKSLQLCLRHGVNDPLPPFQPPGAVGNQSRKICPLDACLLKKQITPNVKVKIPSFLCDKSKLDNLGSNQVPTETRKAAKSSGISRFGVEKDLLPTIGVSQSEMKVTTMNKNLGKKCGQLQKSKEDNFLATSESMASKTCPICKTFSSASNTTLNAHIDQCLSVDSVQPTTKPNRHRIKPRRVRTMTDIYATAKGCTLEELDKRNGTMWTMIPKHSNRVADKPEFSRRGKKRPKVLPATLDEDVISVGPVYVDDRGQKLRILSGFGRESSSSLLREEKDVSLKTKSSKEGKGSKWYSTRKKGRRGKKHHKYLRLIPHSRKLVSQKVDASEMPEHQEGFSGEGSGMEKTQTPKQLKPGQPRILNQRMLAKRTGLSRKLKKKGQKFQASWDQPLENEDWSGDPILFSRKFTDLSVSVSSPLNKQEISRTLGESQVIGKNEAFLRRKSSQSPSLRVRMTENKERSRSFVTDQHNNYQSKKNLALIKERNSAGKVISTDAARYSGGSPGARCAQKLSLAFPAKASRFSMSVDKLPISVPKSFRKLKKARFHLSEEEDEEMGKWESEMTQECELTDEDDSDSGKSDEILMTPSTLIDIDDDDCDDDDDDDENGEKVANREDDLLEKTDVADDEVYQSDTPPSTEICNGSTSPRDHDEICYSEEVGDMFYRQTSGYGAEPDSRVGSGSLFMEVDAIPIPEPPGSFVPSPRYVGSDDYLGFSSVITSQVQSFDLTDRNSSESPLSAVSTPSNSAAVKSADANFPAEFSSLQEVINLDRPTSNSAIPVDRTASSQQANAEPKQSSDTGKFALRRGITVDKGSFPFSNDDQPCCCQRKERFPEGFVVNHHESELLKRRAATSLTIPETKTLSGVDPNMTLSNSEILLDMFEPYTFQDPNLQSKFQNSVNRAATSPSTPVLRLMGKDLMVVNQEQEAQIPASHTESSQRPTPRFLSPSGPVGNSIQTFHHGTGRDSLLPSTHLWSSCAETNVHRDTGLYFGNIASSATPQAPAEAEAEASAVDGFGNSFHLERYFSPS